MIAVTLQKSDSTGIYYAYSFMCFPSMLNVLDSGHPPTDDPALDYLQVLDAIRRRCAFLNGLFVHTAAVLTNIKEPTAKKFWDYTKEGKRFKGVTESLAV